MRPITLLVGENSTGKSTFLGCLNTIHRLLQTPLYYRPDPDFNEDPFLMGSFREIVRARRGPSGRIKEFKIGLGFSHTKGGDRLITLGLHERGSQPAIGSVCWVFGEESFTVSESESGRTSILINNLQLEFDNSIEDALDLLSQATGGIQAPEHNPAWREAMDSFREFMARWWKRVE